MSSDAGTARPATKATLLQGVARLSGADRALLRAFFTVAVAALALGVAYGAATAAARTGLFGIAAPSGYRVLGLHGVTIFFYWLYFAQAGFVLLLARVFASGAGALAWRPLAWLGFAAMLAGFAASQGHYLSGTTLLYDGNPELLAFDPAGGRLFYLGYVLLSLGLMLVASAAIATAMRPRGGGGRWGPVAFATVAWSGLLIVSGVSGLNAFVAPMLWTFGLGEPVAGYAANWHVLFHNMHYLPLMATVVLWYVLVESLTGVRSIFGESFSKVAFALYLVFVPPTSLYHMFLEPGLAEAVRVVGSLLSLFISVPTVLVFVVIVSSLEAHARAQGARGLFGWMARLPWGNPAMAAIGFAVVNLALGGIFSFVLIQEKLAVLISDTFFVPGYFHFLTVGTVSLTFIAALIHIAPALTGGACWRPGLLARLPQLLTAGLALFGLGGIWAGYLGAPRRIFDLGYASEDPVEHIDAPHAWGTLMGVVGAGSLLMAIALALYVYALARMFAPARAGAPSAALPTVSWSGAAVGRHSAWVGPLSVCLLVAGMYLFTALSFEILQASPIVATGGGHGGH